MCLWIVPFQVTHFICFSFHLPFLAIIAPRINLIGYETATAQSFPFLYIWFFLKDSFLQIFLFSSMIRNPGYYYTSVFSFLYLFCPRGCRIIYMVGKLERKGQGRHGSVFSFFFLGSKGFLLLHLWWLSALIHSYLWLSQYVCLLEMLYQGRGRFGVVHWVRKEFYITNIVFY